MEQLFTLLQAVVVLLAALANPNVPADIKLQGDIIANEAIATVQQEMVRLAEQPQATVPTPPITSNTSGNKPSMSEETTQPAGTLPAEQVSQAKLEIVSLNPANRIRKDTPYSVIEPDKGVRPGNYAEIGVVVYDADGNVDRGAELTVTTTDETQNTVKNGTSSYHNPIKKFVYKYQYEFREAGTHTITFTAHGVSESLELTAR